MRELDVKVITENIKEMCIEATHFLTEDMKNVLDDSVTKEESPLGKQILQQLQENLQIAGDEMIPICQDTGMAVLFVEYGERVVIDGNFKEAVEEGVRRAYVGGYLRKSVVTDPVFDRVNTKDNTPAIIYTDIVEMTGASTATISRVNRSLNYGCDGYELVFGRLEEEDKKEKED